MREREIAESILGNLRNDDRPLRDRLYAVLTGALLAVGPPWPEDPEACRLLGEVDQKMRRIQAALPYDPERGDGAGHMLDHMPDGEAKGLAAGIERFAERYAMVAGAA